MRVVVEHDSRHHRRAVQARIRTVDLGRVWGRIAMRGRVWKQGRVERDGSREEERRETSGKEQEESGRSRLHEDINNPNPIQNQKLSSTSSQQQRLRSEHLIPHWHTFSTALNGTPTSSPGTYKKKTPHKSPSFKSIQVVVQSPAPVAFCPSRAHNRNAESPRRSALTQ
jgi:hypothetical protein